MLELRNVTKIYKSKKTRRKIIALDNISIRFPKKGIVTFMGESGCGKSTLMNILAGLDSLTEGKVLYKGKDLSKFTAKDFNNYRRNEIGMVFQDDNLLYDLSVYDNIILPLKFMGLPIIEEEIDVILDKMSITDLKDRSIDELSGGQKQRVAIARTLVKKPKIILADEPTGSLDEDNARIIFELLKEISNDYLVILFTHDKEFAKTYSNYIYQMRAGVIEEIQELEPVKIEDTILEKINKKKGYPFLYLFKNGFQNLKIKIRRLILIIVLSAFAFSLFGVCFSTLGYKEENYFAKQAEQNDFNGTLNVERLEPHLNENGVITRDTPIDTSFIDACNEKFDMNMKRVYSWSKAKLDRFLDETKNNGLYSTYFGEIAVVEEKDLERWNYSLVGYLPKKPFEIAISNYQYECYKVMGFKEGDLEIEGSTITEDVILGKKLKFDDEFEFTITGIFDTGFRVSDYEKLLTEEDELLKRKFETNQFGFNHVHFITEETLALINKNGNLNPLSAAVVLPKNKDRVADIYAYIKSFSHDDIEYKIDYFSMDYLNSTTVVMQMVKVVTGILSIIFAIFSILLMYSYVNITINNREYDIGILRSIGANAFDTATIFSSEVFIISMLNFVISLVITAILLPIINLWLMNMHHLICAPFDYSFIMVVSLFGVCLVAGILSLIVPIFTLTRKKIIHLLK